MTNNHNQYLFLFTIGPVQSFIAQARKTQDLYAGSRILSELTKAAAQEAKDNQNITLVFPTEIPAGNNSFPNRFIGTITSNFSNEQLQAKGQKIEDEVRETFKQYADAALNEVKLTAPAGFDEQIKAHLDINWLFLPMTDNNYGAAYRLIEPYMASLKNMRIIGNEYPEAGRKCSLDGERNALFFGQGSNQNYVTENNAEIVSEEIWLEQNEGLSAVSLLKRAFERTGFPSTAKVALSKQINNLSDENKELLCCYEDLFSKKYVQACLNLQRYLGNISITGQPRTNFDEQLLFEENLTSKNISNASQLAIAKEVQQKLKPHLTQNHYTLIAFDGDKMGALLSGEFCKNKAKATFDLATFQGELSKLLMGFSQWIYDNLDKKQVDVIYAGGDDFLGFVNLEDLFDVVTKLCTEFDKQVNQELQKKYPLQKDGEEYNFSFSMGIVIAHYKTPLNIVLQTAHKMEKLAKSKEAGDRNAFAIAALKHSGENHQAYFKWDLTGDNLPKWEALRKLVRYFVDKECSETFIRSLAREFYLLQNSDGDVQNVQGDVYKDKEKTQFDQRFFMIETELLRLATKSLQEGKKGKPKDLQKTVWEFFKTEDKTTHESVAVRNGIEATKIALFIKRQTPKNNKNGTTD